MRDAREEAAARVGAALHVRVLEPSPPAVDDPPFFADDPLDGGDILPIRRPRSRTWGDLCDAGGVDGHDRDLAAWCADRWLVPAPLAPLPPRFAETRLALHAVAEHVLAPARHAANGRIGLRYTYRGFGTPWFTDHAGQARQLRVQDGALVDGDDLHALSTLRSACRIAGIDVGTTTGVYEPTTQPDPDEDLAVDATAAHAVGEWFGFTCRLLEQIRADAQARDQAAAGSTYGGGDSGDNPSRVQLWPEHFDLAVDLGPEGTRANYGGSPGDEDHPEPYLYVGPWEPREGDFWNEPFGASLSYADILAGADPLAFLRRGRDLLAGWHAGGGS